MFLSSNCPIENAARLSIPRAEFGRMLKRSHVEELIDTLIAVLDEFDGDSDLELNGDEEEPDGTEMDHDGAEDDFPYRAPIRRYAA